ncbi:MAG: hypothetical protein JXR03_18060 [Cyclobacteriaceae bacterium]
MRDSINIPGIEDVWIIHELDSVHVFWAGKNKSVTKTIPYHLNKIVRYRDGFPISERDVFHYESIDSIAYRLVCDYSYEENLVTSFRFIKYFKSRYPPTEGRYVDHFFADSIFNAWGLDNYYDFGLIKIQ